MCALFAGQRDVSLLRHLNREIMGDIITQQAAFYRYKEEETKVNMYGEAAGEKFFDGPFLFNCLITRSNREYPDDQLGVNYRQNIVFAFLRDDLVDSMYVPEVGDIVLYQEGYYEVDSLTTNQYFGGKNPNYPNNQNPLNPGLEKFGSNLSIIAETHYVPADKLNVSPHRERM
tara:strand:- start:440 stop:958 length:519 start_codon:yes stop_codon:yes gene_type:complete